ncbi:MAG: TCP-1/cpn60 chaperonin family protein [Methanospirillum sp.]|uniref:thermosome subunit alpha n=1 Tax=Methanospirillum sp. TaxID=45200 RepID=UPI00236AA38A|nr:thermosome subunit alpha [Methanospirillum sp.]MDD1729917.1 TCP-1/cpn60 chaperonin family protein [Methanospirillum sp.]
MLAQQPVIILRENVERTHGYEAQRSNIAAAKALAEAVRSTLGPRGMDKMLIDGSGDITITNDGITILDEISVQHPGAKMVIEVSRTQDEEVGDGTTTAVVLVGSLMEQAEILLNKKIHPTVICKGYRMGMTRALAILDGMATTVDPYNKGILSSIVQTAITGKSIENVKEKISEIAVEAVTAVAEKNGKKVTVDEDDVQIKSHTGSSMDDAELVQGVVLEKTRVNQAMPRFIKGAKVALVTSPLEIRKTEVKSKIKINSTEQVEAFGLQEREALKAMSDAVIATGANVLLCQKGIADSAQYFLAKAGVMALEDVPEKDMKFAARALNATVANKAEDLTKSMLGTAAGAEEIEDTEMTKIYGAKNPKTVTILLRGTTRYLVDELERAMVDATRVVMDTMEDGKYVPGGAAIETELVVKLRDYAATIGGREQIAIEAYADAFSIIPITLAENSGMNSIDKLVELKSAHAKGKKNFGLNVFTGKAVDMLADGVIEPLRCKRQAIQSSAEAVEMLLRVDDMMVSRNDGPAGPGM